MSNIFNKYYKKYDAWYDRNKFAYLSELKAVKKAVPRMGKGIEIGVGTGRFAVLLGTKYGIDPSKKMLGIAGKREIRIKSGLGEKVPFKNSEFDFVTIIITLCFVKNPEQVLREAKRVLRKNGKIIIGIIDKNSFLGKFYRIKKSVFYKKANFFGIKEITEMLTKIRFSRISYWQTIFELPGKINSVEKPKRGFGEGGFVVISGRKQ
ncbi:MAG: class I SAM-dependent methyltransferase [Candidatus Omnitrophica bacterium]|nr:class I SAM-dependent methyltransferase [Candidatus Omnitrophota bacterium]